MNFQFTAIFPDDLNLQPILISAHDSFDLSGRDYLISIQLDGAKSLYEIRYEHHCSPFKQAIIAGNTLAVGHEDYFYLFNLLTRTNILRLKMEGYFGHLYFENDL